MIITDSRGCKFSLTNTKISELDEKGKPFRWVMLKDIKKHLPKNGCETDTSMDVERWPTLFCNSGKDATWFGVDDDGRLSIGCKDFGRKETRAIYKAAGIRRKVSA